MFKIFRKLIFLILLILVCYKFIQVHHDVKQVMNYRSLVREVLDEQDTVANEELVLAMIYTETKGKVSDVMQSSESATGQKNSILDNKESIRQGVQTLSTNLNVAQEKKVDVWTAVQAYNFGRAYIDYIAKHGGENTLDLAKKYSKNIVAPSLGNVTGKTYSYYHPIALLHGSKLYINGGNFYYSRQVRMNMYIMKVMNWF
ncbi:lysozyme family protein [Streptococcus constellatus subsp. pharyngis]|uniref:Pneumococcal vaccine antigen A n=1 Tax=Streptococcus constellatus subsp. pharyngis SK1060 = CCUG 46377 TaxID=1035184 RepID=U2YBM0_STRCV|nr:MULTISPECIES: lysozyme family protein [Streptococcus]AGU72690.1 putative PvaA-like protein [Streptococcus constellatus subsp. pharyngis C232]AGU74446.1 putative PvaA-like protein [Streptococcus constellatus subsp. pharyngis C818]AGU79863.1 putative PvaA-like protein [Streptococcus constellatus subsp. pharyngis C1050]EUB25718.1 lysozyme-like protein [Streptococcus sp. AS20]KXU02316.1 vaccine antigen A-like protein [Streptococcus constellatus]